MAHPQTITEVPTPALLVDVPAMERNVRRMAKAFVLSLSKHAQRRY